MSESKPITGPKADYTRAGRAEYAKQFTEKQKQSR